MFGTAMSYIFGSLVDFLECQQNYISSNKSSTTCPIFSRYFCDTSNYTSKIPWGKKNHTEGSDCKTKDVTDLPLNIKHWTDRLGKGTNYSTAVQ